MVKTLAPAMLKDDPNQSEFLDFYLPFSGKLSASNRWAKLADLVPWDLVEQCYRESFAGTGMGAPAKSGRIAFGALLIKERLGVTDEETVEQITENPYLQYFLGLKELKQERLFDASMMVHFRSRFTSDHHELINSKIIEQGCQAKEQTESKQEDDQDRHPPSGKLLIDATCTPADIKFPTDLSLLNEAREKSEQMIDLFHNEIKSHHYGIKKPRTYRHNARKQYLALAKQKSPGKKKIRKAVGQQLNYLKRNLGHIDRMLEFSPRLLSRLSSYQYKTLLVIRTLHQQQSQMHQQRTHRVADRIVSISQPHVRPIVRGKAASKVEFGAKVSISYQKDGYVSVDTLSWDAYNESLDLPQQVERYHRRFGHYPESVHADLIYRTRANRKFCKDRGIRLSGKALGRPKKQTSENAEQLKTEKLRQRQDEIDRIPVEGKFGNSKRKGTLERVMAKLANTSESVIHIAMIALNLDKRLCLYRIKTIWATIIDDLLDIQSIMLLVRAHNFLSPTHDNRC